MPERSSASESKTGGIGVSESTFKNRGLERWIEIRRAWRRGESLSEGGSRDGSPLVKEEKERQAPTGPRSIPADAIIARVSEFHRRKASSKYGMEFPVAVTLPQMIDLLQDLWDAEGSFD